MILFIDEYVTVFRRKQKTETKEMYSVLDKTSIFSSPEPKARR